MADPHVIDRSITRNELAAATRHTLGVVFTSSRRALKNMLQRGCGPPMLPAGRRILMIASLVFMLSAAAATTPCEGLAGLKLDKATITSAQMVPEGPAPARGGGRGAANAPAATPPAKPAMIPAHCRL